MNRIEKLHSFGQSIWYDNIERRLLESGELEKMIQRGDIRGVTSNPSIFNNAISRSRDYDAALKPMAWSGWNAEDIFYQLAIEDIRAAADLFLPLYDQTQGGDGYVSLEVSPYLANDTANTVAEARRLWHKVDRPNLMVKIPATKAGVDAIRQSIAAGLNINVTLIFSMQRYAEVMEAYLQGLEERVAQGLPIGTIASVASFFVSRLDSKMDARLETIIKEEGPQAGQAAWLLGKAGIANTRLVYQEFLKTFQAERFENLRRQGAHVQRPLWASTSTKNPIYKDTLYVEELIAADTVNTVPPKTLDSFRDHGEARLSIGDDLDEARKVMDTITRVGISMDQVTDELEKEGVKAFADAFTELLGTVEIRRRAALAELGPLVEAVQKRVALLDKDRFVERLFARDGSLWTPDKKAQSGIAERLGWLDLPETSRKLIDDITVFAQECVLAGFTHALLLGMGGSSLAPETLRLTFGVGQLVGRTALDVTILDSTDPAQVRAAAKRSPIEKTLYLVSSKSGTTGEINAFLEFFWNRARRKLGEQAGSHFVAITDPGTVLEKTARDNGFRAVFQADPTVGGRYSALTAFGLVPAALMGLDLTRLVERAGWMRSQCLPDVPAGRNPGLVLGAILGEAALRGRDKLTILADPDRSALGAWLEQLIAESSGKEGKGIIPVDLEPPANVQDYSPDRIFIYLNSNGASERRIEGLLKLNHPALSIDVPDPYDLGAEFYRWEMATAVACAVLGVNGFDQPDVQDSKDRTNRKIVEYEQKRCFDEGTPIWESSEARIYGSAFPGMDEADTLSAVVRGYLAQSREGDYIAINAYVPRNPLTLSKLQNLRAVVRRVTHRATTLGFGPRFLHSTGQLHKGGPNTGLFIQITADPNKDVDIPGKGMTFGAFERAQALGDFEALLARDRRVIRIHLTGGTLDNCI